MLVGSVVKDREASDQRGCLGARGGQGWEIQVPICSAIGSLLQQRSADKRMQL